MWNYVCEYVFRKLEDWGPYGPPTSSTCSGLVRCTRWGPLGPRCCAVHDGALRAPTAVLYTMGPFGPPPRVAPRSAGAARAAA